MPADPPGSSTQSTHRSRWRYSGRLATNTLRMGGLLQHSLEVANHSVAIHRLNEPTMPRLLQEACFVRGLLHDISNTCTYGSKGKPNPAWKLCSHDVFTLEACAYGLAYLDAHEMTLRHVWSCASPGACYGQSAEITLARYIRDADGQSVMADKQQRALSTKIHWGAVTSDRTFAGGQRVPVLLKQ